MTSLDKKCDCKQHVTWLDSISDTGLTLTAPTVEREGVLLGMQMMPAGNTGSVMVMCFVRRLNDNNIAILNVTELKFKD